MALTKFFWLGVQREKCIYFEWHFIILCTPNLTLTPICKLRMLASALATNGVESSSTIQLTTPRRSKIHLLWHGIPPTPNSEWLHVMRPMPWYAWLYSFTLLGDKMRRLLIVFWDCIPTKELDDIFLILWQLHPYVDCRFIFRVGSLLIVISSPYSAVACDKAWDDSIERLNNLIEAYQSETHLFSNVIVQFFLPPAKIVEVEWNDRVLEYSD